MMARVLFVVVSFVLIFSTPLVFATSTSDTFISTPATLDQINQKVCDRFAVDLNKMAAIMEELRERKGILETRVAFGGVDTPIKKADYWITYAAEALAFQRAQKYSSKSELRYSLEGLKNKLLQAKSEVRKALDDDT